MLWKVGKRKSAAAVACPLNSREPVDAPKAWPPGAIQG
jgi:hypothetical protein